MWKMKIGLILFFLGASGMDSPSMIAPAVITLVGLALMYFGQKAAEIEEE